MLKISHARLQHSVNQELPGLQAGFREGRGARDQIENICWIIEEAIPEKKQQCQQSFAFITPANLEDPTVATGLEKVNSHPTSQEGYYQRMS